MGGIALFCICVPAGAAAWTAAARPPTLRRRVRAACAATGGDDLFSQGIGNLTKSAESAMGSTFGIDDYRFGDLTKKTTQSAESAMGSAFGIENYRFGDLTKKTAKEVSRDLTGKENPFEYEFGDIARKQLSNADSAAKQLLLDRAVTLADDLPEDLWQQVVAGLSPEQRKAVVVAAGQLCAVALLSYGLAHSLFAAGTLASAWFWLSARSGLSPLAAGQWPRLLAAHSAICLGLGPLLLPLRAGTAAALFVPYRAFVIHLQARCARLPRLERHPTLSRVCGLAAACVLANVLGAGAATSAAIVLAGALTGTPIFVG